MNKALDYRLFQWEVMANSFRPPFTVTSYVPQWLKWYLYKKKVNKVSYSLGYDSYKAEINNLDYALLEQAGVCDAPDDVLAFRSVFREKWNITVLDMYFIVSWCLKNEYFDSGDTTRAKQRIKTRLRELRSI